jgi:predicted nucleotidyltransferase
MDGDKAKLIEQVRSFLRDQGLEMAVIFGSFARGEMGKWSDVDIILVSEIIGLELDNAIENRYPLDILFFTPDELENGKGRTIVVREAFREGIMIVP